MSDDSELLLTEEQWRAREAQRECDQHGHDWQVVEELGAGPIGLFCTRGCGAPHYTVRALDWKWDPQVRNRSEDDRVRAVLFNDISYAQTTQHIVLDDRQKIADHLWAQGWRRQVRPEDVNV